MSSYPPPAHCHKAGLVNGQWFRKGTCSFGQNCVHRQTDMKIAYAQLHIHTTII